MGGFIEPNIHPILVHFTYALSLSALFMYFLGRVLPVGDRRKGADIAADWMLALASIAILGTIAAGFYAYYTVAHDGPSHAAMTTHRNWAVPSGAAIILLAVWRFFARQKAPKVLFLSLLTLAALSLSVTAWWGGNIVYKYGLGVQSLPTVTGDGHDHDHSAGTGEAETESTHDHDAGEEHGEVDVAQKADADHSDGAAVHDNSDGHHNEASASLETGQSSESEQAAIADQFGEALRTGDTLALKALLLPNVIIAEGGSAERSYTEYANHHMKSDMAYTANITAQTLSRNVVQGGDMATVITQSEMVGNYKDESVHNRMMETMTLRREDGAWKIAHIHWSSVPITGGEAPMPKPAAEDHDNSDGHHDSP